MGKTKATSKENLIVEIRGKLDALLVESKDIQISFKETEDKSYERVIKFLTADAPKLLEQLEKLEGVSENEPVGKFNPESYAK